MRVVACLLCEAVEDSQSGLFSLRNVFQELVAPKFPAPFPFELLVMLEGLESSVEADLEIFDHDNQISITSKQMGTIAAPAGIFVFRSRSIVVPAPGEYDFRILNRITRAELAGFELRASKPMYLG